MAIKKKRKKGKLRTKSAGPKKMQKQKVGGRKANKRVVKKNGKKTDIPQRGKKRKEEGEKQEEGRHYVMNKAVLKCGLCTQPEGELVVTSNTISLQGGIWATAGDNAPANLIFKGNCRKSPKASQPCRSVIQPNKWKKTSKTTMQGYKALLENSKIKCNYGGVDITIEDHKQTCTPTGLKALEETEAFPRIGDYILVEEGRVKIGNWIKEEDTFVVVNGQGERGYDSIYGDDPDYETMIQNGMTKGDILNIYMLIDLYSDTALEDAVRDTLRLAAGENGADLAEHFFTGGGEPFVFLQGSNPSNEIKNSEEYEVFFNTVTSELENLYKANDYINNNKQIIELTGIGLPNYPPTIRNVLDSDINEATALVGGVQNALISYKIYKNPEGNDVKVEIPQIILMDTSGAGWEDGGANGWKKQMIPGLVQLFVLQHFKNVDDTSRYRPFPLLIDIQNKYATRK